jgi:hypothetical protein
MFRTDDTTPRALKEIKERQVDVIKELHGSGYSYDQLASIFGVKNGAVLRHYVSRDRAPRGDGKILQAIDKKLIDEKDQFGAILPRETINRYIAAHASQKSSSILYQRAQEWPLPADNLAAQCQIYHAAFQIDYNTSMDNLAIVSGKYHAYRTSTSAKDALSAKEGGPVEEASAKDRASAKEGLIVKSYVEINVSEKPRYASFTHWHPDRFYNPAAKSEVRRLNKAPRRSSGVAIHLGNYFYLLGNTEHGHAIDFFALRDPLNADFFSISGFNLSTNLDRVLFSARTILVKDEEATEKDIMRMKTSDFDQELEGFDIRILETISGYVCDNITMMR